MRHNVGRGDASAGNETVGITTRVIPNELLKSLGQTGNKSTTIQSLLNLLKLRAKPGISTINSIKELFNLAGEGSDGCITTSTPNTTTAILPRHPKDPVDGLLQVGRAVKVSAKAAEVEAVGATGKGRYARVTGEGGGGGAGGLYSVEEISDVVVTNYGPTTRGLIKVVVSVPKGLRIFCDVFDLLKPLRSPPALAFTLPVEVGEADIHDRHDT
ncbi:FecR family protein [Babesia caballi]|uniref:FecR family protein n=1 Tax=Babesia caballi TaxID=5871 RepID=A0AAV4LYK9_BABCB|nr:FecR family protein [Babesia caballi]